MNVFYLLTGADTAGGAVRTKEAFSRHAPGWTFRSMVSGLNYIDYPVDVPYTKRAIPRLYDAADVVMIGNTLHAYDWYDNGQGKPGVMMHNGWWNRQAEMQQSIDRARDIGFRQVCSTYDMELMWPGELTWAPIPYSLDILQRIRRGSYRPDGVVRIGHAPTNREIKGTDAFLRAAQRLRKRKNVEIVLIENQPWRACLPQKATLDIFFDQMVLGYGCNAIEAWGMGIPVVAGVVDKTIREGMRERFGGLPFAEADEATIHDVLSMLVDDVDARNEFASLGDEHFRRFHEESAVVENLKNVFLSAIPTVPDRQSRRQSRRTVRQPRRYEPWSFWEKEGHVYEQGFLRSDAFARQEEALLSVLETMTFDSVLDLGCGFGRVSRLIADRWPGVRITGVDLSADMLDGARRRLPGAEFVCSTIEEFDAGGRKWDLVLCSEVLMHVLPADLGWVFAKVRSLSDRYVVTIDWDTPIDAKPAAWNFLHDYAALYGPEVTRVGTGLQGIYSMDRPAPWMVSAP